MKVGMETFAMILLVIGILMIFGGAFRIMVNHVDLGWFGTALVFIAVFFLPHLR